MPNITKNSLRKQLFKSLSDMYAAEVPLYDKLLETVLETNLKVASQRGDLNFSEVEIKALSGERHGAIRLGKPEELRNMARFFACLDMHPINFYNLADAGAKSQPVISTAFRPLKNADHRVFCSLLMTDYFAPEIGKEVEEQLKDRQIFSDKLLNLMEISKKEGGLKEAEAEEFLNEAKQLFGWQGKAKNLSLYKNLVAEKVNIAADIACFPNSHLNHLTPNSLDIDYLYQEFSSKLKGEYGSLNNKGMKDSIEGPPKMKNLVLLRQTSYKALDEEVIFSEANGSSKKHNHTARFGEIEQRGVALTKKGREIYDRLLAEGKTDYESFTKELPDDYEKLKEQGLAYFRGNGEPIRYEDFLPVSAAGIFASNLEQYGTKAAGGKRKEYKKEILEEIMQKGITESDDLYRAEAEE